MGPHGAAPAGGNAAVARNAAAAMERLQPSHPPPRALYRAIRLVMMAVSL